MEKSWYVYILQCADNTFYTGITDDPQRRLAAHNQGKGAKYTKGRRPVSIRYLETQPDRASASKREYQIKSLSRAQKQNLINGSD